MEGPHEDRLTPQGCKELPRGLLSPQLFSAGRAETRGCSSEDCLSHSWRCLPRGPHPA